MIAAPWPLTLPELNGTQRQETGAGRFTVIGKIDVRFFILTMWAEIPILYFIRIFNCKNRLVKLYVSLEEGEYEI